MKVTFDKLMSAINTYIERDLMPVTMAMGTNPLGKAKQFLFGFGVGVIKEQASTALNDFMHGNIAQIFKIVDEDGNIDADVLYRAAKYSMHNVENIKILDVAVGETDIDKIYSYLR